MLEALDIHVTGVVQGVGFRPFVYRAAKRNLVSGWVLNAVDGVDIHAEGESRLLDTFVIEISENAPAAAQVREIDLKEVPLQGCEGFEIRFSDAADSRETTLVSPDLATCDDCVRELFDPADRRYRYPFINCTNCGPRFTIIDKLPYDRPATSMKGFEMCPDCAAEYADPGDRRFHAQPDACFACGPRVSWRRGDGPIEWGDTREASDAIFAEAVELLLAGGIVAVKGLGGFHLACDASNAQAVANLRERKHREGKAFAVMMGSADDARRVCLVNDAEQRLLEGPQRPIVLLRKLPGVSLTPRLADKLPELGVMLPCTPVQHLLMHDFAEAVATRGGGRDVCGAEACADAADIPPMLVMTSGNIHDEPIVTDDEAAYERLAGVADAFLGNDRPILSRYDDSVARIVKAGSSGDAVQMIRRARGFAPAPIAVEQGGDLGRKTLLAVGPEQKNTLAYVRQGAQRSEAFVSQHIGDMENAETFDAWLEAKERYARLFRLNPSLLACDPHPEYLSTKWAREQARKEGMPLAEVQHHHAHIASVLGENAIDDAVCGIAFDGTGYGIDGAIWGGEVLLANRRAFERFANFAYFPMPGGAAAIKNPLRMAYGALWEFDLLDHPAAADALASLGADALELCDRMIERGLNTPYTSSVGRLFDAASALLGICTDPTYEGEPAILLEAAIEGESEGTGAAGPSASAEDGATVCTQTSHSSDCSSEAHEAEGRAAERRVAESSADADGPDNSGRLVAESSADADARARYRIEIVKNTATPESTAQDTSVLLLDAAPVFKALLDDRAAGVPVGVIARRFHDAFVQAIADVAELCRALYGIGTVALSGGVFMNRYLIEHALEALERAGFTVAVNRELPPNDGCVSYGQAVVAWAANDEKA